MQSSVECKDDGSLNSKRSQGTERPKKGLIDNKGAERRHPLLCKGEEKSGGFHRGVTPDLNF